MLVSFLAKNADIYFKSLGIIYQISCPHASQQNEVLERK